MIWYFLLAAGLLVFFWDEVKAPFMERYEKTVTERRAIIAAERIARVKMLSDSPRDIEDFISKNVSVISDDTMNQLVARLETIKSDKIIDGDNLKSKFDVMFKEEVEAELPSRRKHNGAQA